MHKSVYIFLIIGFLYFSHPYLVQAQSVPLEPLVISPRGGEAIQGSIEISGITEITDFARTEVEYRYTNDPKNTWFLIAETDQTVNPGKITDWDTTSVTDGTYDLRVTVILKNNDIKPVTVPGIRIRNYSPVETSTLPVPGSLPLVEETVATPIPTRTPRPTSIPFPSNPAILTNSDLGSSLMRGATAGIGFFLAFAIYWIVKKSLS
jgi:hypothetical protein